MSLAHQARGTVMLRRLSCQKVGWQHWPATCGMAPSRPAYRRTVRMASSSDKINTTLAGLDALLGIEEKKEEEKEQEQAKPADVSIAPEVLTQLAEAERKRAANLEPQNSMAVQQQIDRLTEQAKRLAEGQAKPGEEKPGDAALRKEFEALANMLGAGQGISHEDVKTIKESVFKRTAFWVTEAKALPGVLGGILVRGNLKAPAQQVFDEVVAGTQQVLGDKYIVRVVPDIQAMEDDFGSPPPAGTPPRVAFEFLPTALSTPPEMARWQRVAAGVLLLLTLGSTFQLAVGANIGLLPKETLLWLADPANLDPLNEGMVPPGLEDFDPVPFFQSLTDVCLVTLLPQLAHELGHTVTAALKKIKIGASFLIPNSQLGTFGSVTQLKSFVRNRSDLFDFAVSGLAAGGAVSLALFFAGLALSHGGNTPEPGLVPVPSQLFQGSLFLGGLARLAFGSDVISNASVYVHPMLIGGWCGLVTTAFNSLPVGNLDGGRSMMASFGRNGLAVSSFLTYIGLGLSLLGSSLAWPFGIYLLICQRESERYIQDEVTEVGERRQAVSAALIVLAILILLPIAPEVADTVGVGTPIDFL